jgi:hypothetical protein
VIAGMIFGLLVAALSDCRDLLSIASGSRIRLAQDYCVAEHGGLVERFVVRRVEELASR